MILNGPNLNMLGKREVEIYGGQSFESYLKVLRSRFPAFEIDYHQSNIEGELVNTLQEAESNGVEGILLNAAAYTHTSIAIADTIKAIDLPVLEVHISNIMAREEERHTSLISANVIGSISGFGLASYELGIHYFESLATQKS